MNRQELIQKLIELRSVGDVEKAHKDADKLLLEYIGDDAVTQAFTELHKWYA